MKALDTVTVTTDVALMLIADKAPHLSREQAHETLMHWRRTGKVPNVGGTRRGQARWNVRQLLTALDVANK